MKIYSTKLLTTRWWSNTTEDVPYEHIEEMMESLNAKWEEEDPSKFHLVDAKSLYFFTDTRFTDENQILKIVDGNDIFYYIFDETQSIMNNEDKIIYQVIYVLDEWMSSQCYRYRNNIYHGTNVWFYNKHCDRFIQKGANSTTDRTDRGRWTVDYKNQTWLRAPNTSIQIQTEQISQQVIPSGISDISEDYCIFFQPLDHNALGNANNTGNQKYIALVDSSVDNGNFCLLKTISAPTTSISTSYQRVYRKLPNGEMSYNGSELLGDKIIWTDGRGCYPASLPYFYGETFVPLIQQDWLANSNYMVKWKTIDEMFNISNTEGIKRYQYAIFRLAAAEGKYWNQGGDLNILKGRYYTSTGTVAEYDEPEGNNLIILPIITDELGKTVNYKYWKPGGTWTGKGNITSGSISFRNWDYFQQILKNSFNINTELFVNIETSYPPSYLVQFLNKSADNHYNRGYEVNPDTQNVVLMNGMNLLFHFGAEKTVNSVVLNPSAANTFNTPENWAVDYTPFFIGNFTDIQSVFDNLQDDENGIKFFKAFKDMLNNANSADGKAPLNNVINEPLLYNPLYFNLRYNLQNDGRGSLTADMLNWEVIQNGTGKVNIVTNAGTNVNPAYNSIYRWDIETCLHPNFETSPSREEFIFTDRRMMLSQAPKTFYDPEHETQSNAFTGAGGGDGVGGLIQDAANSSFRAGSSLFDANETASWVQKHQAALGKNFAKASFKAQQGLQKAQLGAVAGAGSMVIKSALSIPKIFSQRCNVISQPRAYNIPIFSADILLGDNSGNLWNKAWFCTTFLTPVSAWALWAYHSAYGYYLNLPESFKEVVNRKHFNYILVDTGWNSSKIVKDSINGEYELSPFYKTRESSQEWLDRLALGLRVHYTLANNMNAWDVEDPENTEIRLEVTVEGYDEVWTASDIYSPEVKNYKIKVYNPDEPSGTFEILQYDLEVKGLASDMVLEKFGDSFNITWNHTTPADYDTDNGIFEISIKNVKAGYPYETCYVKNYEANVNYATATQPS